MPRPERGRPGEKWRATFAAARAALIALPRKPGQALEAHTAQHCFLGTMNALQWLALTAAAPAAAAPRTSAACPRPQPRHRPSLMAGGMRARGT